MSNTNPGLSVGTVLSQRDNSLLPRHHWKQLLASPQQFHPKERLPRNELGVYYVHSGLVKQTHLEPTSKRPLVALIASGDVVDELSLFDRTSPDVTDVVAVFSSIVSFVSKAAF